MNSLSPYVDRILALGSAGTHPAGTAIGVQRGDQREVAWGGWALLPTESDPGVPMWREVLFDLASVTKLAVTTTLSMQLVAAGELSLEAPVASYLPAFPHPQITVEQLLTHTAGLKAWWPLYCVPDDPIATICALPLAAEPGTRFDYSDLGVLLAGAVVSAVIGQSLEVAFAERVAGPLGLAARFGPLDPALAAASADSDGYEYAMLATGTPHPVPFGPNDYGGWRTGVVRGEVADGNATHAFGGVAAHAGLFASIDDLVTLGSALRSGFVPGSVLARFARPSPVNPAQAVGFRRRILPGGGVALEHPGFTGSYLGFALDEPLVVAAAATRLHGTVGPLLPQALPDTIATADVVQVAWQAAG
ncbi:serine hydrolase [Branchiibius sp. NY16-3462-2]|uniref:serine hydrolase domain-containing protein n=1 Tax=Branchiibius sp. NY16-3462-2 TaxID=1807500 RepID=UPI0007953FF7|nr:serine hydrolase domain-containing protein [Branchiibius sp. NY16-3462-2]KYH45594.1 hypothetical protein AZH51_17895 [Branchiibius sp. NY16-3462-2]